MFYCNAFANSFDLAIPGDLNSRVAISIKDITANQNTFAHNESAPMLLASNMKLVTTYIALKALGPDFTWSTKLAYTGKIKYGNLMGNLYLIGGGDPQLTSNDLNKLFEKLNELGISSIKGDVIVDTSIFNSKVSTSELSPEPLADYSVIPSGLIIDSNLSTLIIKVKKKKVKLAQQMTKGYTFINRLKVINSKNSCNSPSDYIKLSAYSPSSKKITLTGNIPPSCDQHGLAINLLDNKTYNEIIIKKSLQKSKIAIDGHIKSDKVPARARLISSVNSPTLAQLIIPMNKYSINLYAETFFLSLGAYKTNNSNTYEDSKNFYLNTLKSDFSFPELTLENGAGLSRHEKLTSAHMVELLTNIYNGPNEGLIFSSLPTPQEPGTLQQNFTQFINQFYAKTGSLSDTQAYSGYFKARNGHTYAVSFLANRINNNSDTHKKSQLEEFKELIVTALNNLNLLDTQNNFPGKNR